MDNSGIYFFIASDASFLLGVTPKTIRNWIKLNQIEYKLSTLNHSTRYLFSLDEINRKRIEKNKPVLSIEQVLKLKQQIRVVHSNY